jgi:hypothetical protein
MKKIIISGYFIFFISFFAHSQCIDIKDTVYVISMHGNLENGSPISSYFILKRWDGGIVLDKANRNTYLMGIYSTAIHLSEPMLSFDEMLLKCSKNKPYDSLNNNFIIGLRKMNRRLNPLGVVALGDQQKISFEMVKISGQFWVLDKDIGKMNNITNSFYINDSWYKSNHSYCLKQVIQVFRLSKAEKYTFSKLFMLLGAE